MLEGILNVGSILLCCEVLLVDADTKVANGAHLYFGWLKRKRHSKYIFTHTVQQKSTVCVVQIGEPKRSFEVQQVGQSIAGHMTSRLLL